MKSGGLPQEAQQWVSFFIHKDRFTKPTNREVVVVARKRNPKTDEAEKLFRKGLKLKDIPTPQQVPKRTDTPSNNTNHVCEGPGRQDDRDNV